MRYRRGGDGDLVPETVRNPVSVWGTGPDSLFYAPLDNAGTQYRTLRQHAITAQHTISPSPQLTGTFGQAKIAAFDPLSRVPLGPYQPTVAAPADAASRRALGGGNLLPSMNLGGYVSQPVQLITTLAALPTVESRKYTGDARLRRAPISVIRVRVAGVTGPNPVSLNRIKEVAEQIELRTHLTVDIVAGSSPAPVTVALPAGRFGYPALLLSEDWVKKGVAVSILDAVDRSSVALFVLILVVCALFVANSATAAVRARRAELGVLTALGWTRPRLFTTERAAELATIRAFGWPEPTLRRLVITEGALTGLAGSATGAVLGLVAAAVFAGQLPPLLFAAAGAAIAAGILVTCVAALLPAQLLRRLPAAQLLAEE